MKLLKKVIAVLAIATMSLSMVACGTSKASSEMASKDLVVAQVADVPIYKTALENEMSKYGMTDSTMQMYYGADYTSNAEIVGQYNKLKGDIVDSLIETEILVFKAKEMKDGKVTEDEINEQLEATKANFTSEDEFNKALEQSGMTLDQLKENIEKRLYVTKLIDHYAENEVTITDKDIEDYYNTNIAKYTTKPGANIYHILVDTEEKANEVLEKYNAGTSFADLAAEYGTDGTKDVGGSLGYIEYDTTSYDADFMAGAKALGEGEVSKPVKTQFGWHIIKVDGIKKEEVVQPLEEVKDSIQKMLKQNKAQEVLTEKLEEWKKEYEITRYEENYITEVTEAKESPEASDNATQTSDSQATESPATTDDAKEAQSATESSEASAETSTESPATSETPAQ